MSNYTNASELYNSKFDPITQAAILTHLGSNNNQIDPITLSGMISGGSYGPQPVPVGGLGIGESRYDEPGISLGELKANDFNVDYIRAKRQPASHKFGLGLTRSALSVLTKFGEGVGFVGALPFAGIEAATGASKEEVADTLFDNFWVNAFAGMEQELKNQMPVYKSKKYAEGTLGQTLWTPEFWADDFMDGVAFMASAMIPGGIMSKADLMGKTGLGMKFATNLSKTKLGQMAGAGKDLTKLANSLDLAGLTMYNTISEAGFEAKDTYDMLLRQGVSKDEAATSAFRTAALNGLVLLGPNALQQSFFFGKNGLVTPAAKQAIRKSIQDGSFKAVDDLFPSLKSKILTNVGKGIFSEGFVEEASQSAIQNYESKLRLDSKDWTLGGLITQYVDGLFNDKDTQKATIIGSILGAGGGTVGAIREKKQDVETLDRIKKVSQLSNDLFEKNIRTIYKTKQVPVEKKVTNTDGKETTVTEMQEQFVTDENGRPVIDPDKVIKLTKQLVYDKKLIDEAAVAEILGDEAGANMLTDLMLARSVYNYASMDDTGIALEYFKTKLEVEAENQKQLKPEEQDGVSQILAEKLELIDEFSNTYNNTVGMEKNTMIGKIKFFEAIKRSSLKRTKADTSALEQDSQDFVDKLNEEFIKKEMNLTEEITDVSNQLKELLSKDKRTEQEENNLNDLMSEFSFLKEQYETAFGNIPLDVITEDEADRLAKDYKPGIKGETLSRYGDRYIGDTKVNARLQEVKNGELSEEEFFNIAIDEKNNNGIKEETQKEVDDWFTSRDIDKKLNEKKGELEAAKKEKADLQYEMEPVPQELEDKINTLEKEITTAEQREKRITQLRNKFNNVDGFIAKETQENLTDEQFLLQAAGQIIEKTFRHVQSNYEKDKENYTQIGAVNKALNKLNAALRVLTRKEQDTSIIKDYIARLEKIKEAVEINLRNRNAKQETFEKNQSHNFYRGIGIKIKDESYEIEDKELYDLIEEVVGKDKMQEILIDAVSFTKSQEQEVSFPIIHLKVILDLFKLKAGADKKKHILDLLKAKKNQIEFSHVNAPDFRKTPYAKLQQVLNQNISISENAKSNPYIKFKNSNDPFSYLEDLKAYNGTDFKMPVEEIIKDVENAITVLAYQDTMEYLLSQVKVEDSIESEQKYTGNDYKFAPTNQQLFAIRKFFERLSNPSQNKFISYLKGVAGSGKTSVIGDFMKGILELEDNEIVTAAHTNWSSNNIKNAITPNGVSRTINQLNQEVEEILKDENIKLIILDEVGGMLGQDLIDLTNSLKEINKERVKNNKQVVSLLMLGDPTQLTMSDYSTDPVDFLDSDLNILQAPTLNIVYRSNVSAIAEASNAFQSNPFLVENLYVQTNSLSDEITPMGVNKLKGTNNIIEAVTKRLGNGRKKLIIVRNEEDKQKYESLLSDRKVIYENFEQPEVEVVTVLEAQGRTIPEVYVDIELNISDNFVTNLSENTLLYTAISRASEYAGIVDYGNWFNEVQDENITNDVARNQKEIEDSKKQYDERIINELSKIYELKNLDKKVNIPTPPTKPTETEDDVPNDIPDDTEDDVPEETEEVEVPEDIVDDLPEEEGSGTEGQPQVKGNFHWIKFPTFDSLKTQDSTSPMQMATPDKAEIGARVIYTKAKRQNSSEPLYVILAETRTPGKYVEIGVMSSEEMETPLGKELIANGKNTKSIAYTFDSDGVIRLPNPQVLKEGVLGFKQGLTYVYSQNNRYSLKDAITKFLSGFFIKAGLVADKDLNKRMYVKIFRNRDIRGEFALPIFKKTNMTVIPGIPYLVIENPKSKSNKKNTETAPQFIRLEPKKIKKDNPLLEPIITYKNLVEQAESILSFKLGDENFSEYVSKFKDNYIIDETGSFPIIRLKPENEFIDYNAVSSLVTEEEFNKTMTIMNSIIPLIYGPEMRTLTFTEKEFQKYMETSSLDKDLVEKVPIKKSDKFKIKYKNSVDDKNYSLAKGLMIVRGKGTAQHNFNALARANSSIRIKRNIPSGGKFIINIFGKSLLDSRDSEGAYNKFLHELLQKDIDSKGIKNKPIFVRKSNQNEVEDYLLINDIITLDELNAKKKELVSNHIDSNKLEELFGDNAFNENGEHSFRNPINAYEFNKIASEPGTLSTKKQQEDAFNKIETFVDSRLEEVKPTSAQVIFNTKPIKATATVPLKSEDVEIYDIDIDKELEDFANFRLVNTEKNSTFAEDIEESKNAEELKKKCKE